MKQRAPDISLDIVRELHPFVIGRIVFTGIFFQSRYAAEAHGHPADRMSPACQNIRPEVEPCFAVTIYCVVGYQYDFQSKIPFQGCNKVRIISNYKAGKTI